MDRNLHLKLIEIILLLQNQRVKPQLGMKLIKAQSEQSAYMQYQFIAEMNSPLYTGDIYLEILPSRALIALQQQFINLAENTETSLNVGWKCASNILHTMSFCQSRLDAKEYRDAFKQAKAYCIKRHVLSV